MGKKKPEFQSSPVSSIPYEKEVVESIENIFFDDFPKYPMRPIWPEPRLGAGDVTP